MQSLIISCENQTVLSQNNVADDAGESSDQVSQQNLFVNSIEQLSVQVFQAELASDEVQQKSKDSSTRALRLLRWTSLLS